MDLCALGNNLHIPSPFPIDDAHIFIRPEPQILLGRLFISDFLLVVFQIDCNVLVRCPEVSVFAYFAVRLVGFVFRFCFRGSASWVMSRVLFCGDFCFGVAQTCFCAFRGAIFVRGNLVGCGICISFPLFSLNVLLCCVSRYYICYCCYLFLFVLFYFCGFGLFFGCRDSLLSIYSLLNSLRQMHLWVICHKFGYLFYIFAMFLVSFYVISQSIRYLPFFPLWQNLPYVSCIIWDVVTLCSSGSSPSPITPRFCIGIFPAILSFYFALFDFHYLFVPISCFLRIAFLFLRCKSPASSRRNVAHVSLFVRLSCFLLPCVSLARCLDVLLVPVCSPVVHDVEGIFADVSDL